MLIFAQVKEDWIVTDFLDEKRREITERLTELGPLVEEYHRLEAAAAALVGIGGKTVSAVVPRRRGRPPGSGKKAAASAAASASAPTKKRGRPPGRPKKVGRPKGKKVGRPAGSTTKTAPAAGAATAAAPAKRRAGRRKGSGTRAAQALSFVQGQPGITIPELAAKMGIKQNYLYRVLPALEQEGKLSKQGRGWHPKG
jgi:hypothetical protein